MHRIRTTTAAIASTFALIGGGAAVAAHADEPVQEPCAKQEAKVEKAEDALARVTAVFERQKEKVADARDEVAEADTRSEKAQARAELREAKAKKEKAATTKKAQQQRLAKAQERLDECTAGEESEGEETPA